MPFEGDIADFTKISPPVVETPAQRVIRQARDLIGEPSRWVRNWQSGEAFCILGALRHAHHGNANSSGTGGAQDVVMRVLRRRGYTGITTFNDGHASHTEVVAVLDAAYELAGKPKGARLDLSEVHRKPPPLPPMPRAPRMPPPTVFYPFPRRSTADVIEHLIPAQRACDAFPDPLARAIARGAFSRAIDMPLLVAASFVLRRSLA